MIDTECLFLAWGHFLSISLSLAFIDAVSYLVSKENNDAALPKQIIIRNINVEFLINNFKILLFFKLGVFCCGIKGISLLSKRQTILISGHFLPKNTVAVFGLFFFLFFF